MGSIKVKNLNRGAMEAIMIYMAGKAKDLESVPIHQLTQALSGFLTPFEIKRQLLRASNVTAAGAYILPLKLSNWLFIFACKAIFERLTVLI